MRTQVNRAIHAALKILVVIDTPSRIGGVALGARDITDHMKKKSGKGKSPRARAVKDLTASDARQVKGGEVSTVLRR